MSVGGHHHILAALPAGNIPDIHWVGSRVSPRAKLGVYVEQKMLPHRGNNETHWLAEWSQLPQRRQLIDLHVSTTDFIYII